MQQSQQTLYPKCISPKHLLNGQLASLGWIVGRDCQRGIKAYLQTAKTNPDAAIVGTGWVDPTTGHLINGQSNNCMPGNLRIDNLVQLVHNTGGNASLKIIMITHDSPRAWASQQQS